MYLLLQLKAAGQLDEKRYSL